MSILVGGRVPEIELTSTLLQPSKFLRYLEPPSTIKITVFWIVMTYTLSFTKQLQAFPKPRYFSPRLQAIRSHVSVVTSRQRMQLISRSA